MTNLSGTPLIEFLRFPRSDTVVYPFVARIFRIQDSIRSGGFISVRCLHSDILFAITRKRARFETLLSAGFSLYSLTVKASLIFVFLFSPLINDTALSLDHFSEGVAAANRGHFEKATELFSRAIQKNPYFYAAYANRGSVLIRSGHILKGIEDWHRARELAPPFAYAIFTGALLQHSPRKNRLLNFVLTTELDPELLPSITMTGAAYTDLGHAKSAAVLFRKSIDLTRNPLWKSYFEYWAKSLEESP